MAPPEVSSGTSGILQPFYYEQNSTFHKNMNSEFKKKVLNVFEVFKFASESLIFYLKIVSPQKRCFLFF